MRVLVTGAAGFIGGHLVERLSGRGDEVTAIDNFDPYYDPRRKRSRARRLAELDGVRFVEQDIRRRRAIRRLVVDGGFDAVAHLAALAGVRAAVARPARYVNVNLNGTQSVLDAARAAPSRPNVVIASTSSVYGETERIPFVEDDPCDRPLQPYAASKRAAELLAHSYHHLYDLDVTALRFFTVYGPRNRPDMMAYRLARSIVDGSKVALYEGGVGIYRDWTFVDDIVHGIVRGLDRRLGFAIVNLGRGEPVELRDFVATLAEVAGSEPNVELAELPAADVRLTYADVTRARELLGYAPTTSVREGVEALWKWYETSIRQTADH